MYTVVSPAWAQATGQLWAVSVALISISHTRTSGRPARASTKARSAARSPAGRAGQRLRMAWMSLTAAVSL